MTLVPFRAVLLGGDLESAYAKLSVSVGPASQLKHASPSLDAALAKLLNSEGWQHVEKLIRRQMRLKPRIRLKEKKLLSWREIYGWEAFDPKRPAMTAADMQGYHLLQADGEMRTTHLQFHKE